MDISYTLEELYRMLEEAYICKEQHVCPAMKDYEDRRISHISKRIQEQEMKEWNL
jgi:hypothetical protein